MLFSKMNLKAIVLGVVGLASVAAAQDLPTLSLESNTIQESKDWQTISLFLNVEPASPVSFKYCFEFQSENGVAGTYAGYSDLGEADADHLFPMCDKEESVSVTIPAGVTSTEVIVIKPLKDGLVETDEKLWLKITELSGAVLSTENFDEDKGFVILISDEVPIIENQTFEFRENNGDGSDWETGTSVACVEASDLNGDKLSYTVATENVPFLFKDDTCELVVTDGEYIDYESKPTWIFDVIVSDGHGSSAKASITINLIDVDEPFKFLQYDPVLHVDENTALGSEIGTVAATDDDCNNPNPTTCALPTYSLAASEGYPNDYKSFTIDANTGLIKVNGTLNFESQTVYFIRVVVTDDTHESYSSSIDVYIDINDLNEKPEFPKSSYEFSIDENAIVTILPGSVVAVDHDVNASITYSLEGEDAASFEINAIGELFPSVNTVFDYETKPSYTFDVVASDGELEGKTSVTVNVTNVPEAPVFLEENPTFSVEENVENAEVGVVAAVDDDCKNDNACDAPVYSLAGTDENLDDYMSFTIDEKTGAIKVNGKLDYETKSSYEFNVVVTDGEFENRVPVTVNVTDVNEAPIFVEPTKTLAFSENEMGAVIDTLTFDDFDIASEFRNNKFECTNCDDYGFELNEDTGELKTTRTFDYETDAHSYDLNIVIKDAENADLATTGTVTVNLKDVQETPVFAKNLTTTFEVDEDAVLGTLVGTVTATDGDCGGEYSTSCAKPTYSLSPAIGTEAKADAFTIDGDGNIMVAGTFDFDTKSVYEYHVIATDGENADLSSSIDVTINIFNILNKPTITDDGKAGYDVTEFASTDMVIACYVVDDKDLSQVAKLKPSLKDLGNTKAGDLFGATIKRDGSAYKLCLVVKNGDKLDYEKIAHTHKVEISVTDPDLLSASLTKTINITDVNEKPSISGSLTHAFYEHEGKNHMVGQLSVEDPDTSKTFTNNVFAIVAGDTALFSITENGLIKTKRDFDFEKETRYVYNVSVTLSDKDSKNYPTYKDTAVVQITLKDSPNDPVSSSSSKPASSSSSKPASSSSKANVASSSSKVYVASSSSQFVVEPESSASSSNSSASEYAAPTFRVKMCAPFEFEIIMTEFSPSLAKQYAVMDMMGHVLSAGELSDGSARVTVPTRGAYVVRVGLGYKRVNVK